MSEAQHVIRCRCGHLRGALPANQCLVRLRCYCRDCQAYAHALGAAGVILDTLGGTQVVVTLQQYLRFTEGTDKLGCLSLSRKGLLRWYASCCDTPIGNTTRDPRVSFLGLVHTCLDGSPSTPGTAFDDDPLPVNVRHAKGRIRPQVTDTLVATARIAWHVLRARADGTWRKSPFFAAGTLAPVVVPRILTEAEREKAYRDV